MKINLHVDTIALDAAKGKLYKAATKTERALPYQIVKDTERFVPALTKSLSNRTQVVENMIVYPGPYARYLYYGKVMVDSETGKGAAHFLNQHGEDVFYFRKGAKLKSTERDLVFTTSVHPDAQAHWMEVSESLNKEKWNQIAARDLLDAYGKQ